MICFFFIILHCQTQWIHTKRKVCHRCDLLLFYYFCTVKHNIFKFRSQSSLVVICFFFIIFALSNTIRPHIRAASNVLWFASFLLFLHCQTQSIRYWTQKIMVVICFFFIIFALSNTIRAEIIPGMQSLWFASFLLFLHCQTQYYR